MKTKLLITIATVCIGITSAQAGPSWGFTLGNGAGFYWGGNRPQQNYNYYVAPCPPPRHYYQPQVHFYIPPQPMYMRPYQQLRPYNHYRPCR